MPASEIRPWRLFCAVELPVTLRSALARCARRLGDRIEGAGRAIPIRWVAPEAMHLTLRFFGDTAPDRVEPLRDALQAAAAAHPAHTATFEALGAFPNARRPRVLVARLAGSPALSALAAAIEQAAQAHGATPETRPFRGHVTLGRIKTARGGRRSRRDARSPDLGPVLAEAGPLPQDPLRIDAISLLRSELRPDGPRYHLVARLPLSG